MWSAQTSEPAADRQLGGYIPNWMLNVTVRTYCDLKKKKKERNEYRSDRILLLKSQ